VPSPYPTHSASPALPVHLSPYASQ
jgi:hypothetical protein